MHSSTEKVHNTRDVNNTSKPKQASTALLHLLLNQNIRYDLLKELNSKTKHKILFMLSKGMKNNMNNAQKHLEIYNNNYPNPHYEKYPISEKNMNKYQMKSSAAQQMFDPLPVLLGPKTTNWAWHMLGGTDYRRRQLKRSLENY